MLQVQSLYCISSTLSLHDECCTALLLLVVEFKWVNLLLNYASV